MAEKKIKNTLEDLNDHLFEQLERLNDDSLTGEQLEREIRRADAMGDIAGNIIANANTVLRAAELQSEIGKLQVVPRVLLG